jgi:hypothetical protein
VSRHEIPFKQEDHIVAIGWDNPMMTYFVQVERVQTASDPRHPRRPLANTRDPRQWRRAFAHISILPRKSLPPSRLIVAQIWIADRRRYSGFRRTCYFSAGDQPKTPGDIHVR